MVDMISVATSSDDVVWTTGAHRMHEAGQYLIQVGLLLCAGAGGMWAGDRLGFRASDRIWERRLRAADPLPEGVDGYHVGHREPPPVRLADASRHSLPQVARAPLSVQHYPYPYRPIRPVGAR